MADPQHRARRVAVVGAGIGGLAAAVALTRAGLPVDVYEQAPALREVGVGMHLGSNGTRILDGWGLGAALRRVAVRSEALEVRDGRTGRTLVREPMGEQWEQQFGAPYFTVHRADLHSMLAAQLPPERLHLSRRLMSADDNGSTVTLRFMNGGTAEADVVVGADGVHSVLRAALAGDRPIFSGTSACRGLVATAGLGVPTDSLLIWAGAESRLLAYPVSGGRYLTFVAMAPDQRWRTESWSTRADPVALREPFADWHTDVRKILMAAREPRRWALYDREPLPRWSRGRITLLGDAAHPMLPHHGQGVAQALEDAVALAHSLAGARPDAAGAAAALQRYEQIRRPHTTRVQLGARGGGAARMPDGAGGGGSGAAMSALIGDVSWIQRYDIGRELAADAVPAGMVS